MMKLLKNKYKIIFIFSVLLLLLLAFLIRKVIPSLSILFLFPMTLLSGLGFNTIFRKVLPSKNIISFIINSVFLSLFLNTALIFVLGACGFDLSHSFFNFYLLFSSIFSLIIFLIWENEMSFAMCIRDTKLELVDICWIVLLSLMILSLFSIGLENYFPNWDSFNYWGVDAKYIYENESFRDGTFDLLRGAYLPFYPLQLNYIYHLYGGLVEQYSGLLALFYAFIGVMVVVGNLINYKKNPIVKSLIYLISVGVLYYFYDIQGIIFTQYSELFCSVLILFYGVMLISKDFNPKHYHLRFFLIVSLLISLYITKSNYLILSLALFFFYVFFDFKTIKQYSKKIINWKLLLIILSLIFYLVIINIYTKQLSAGSGEGISQMVSSINLISRTRVLYTSEYISFLFAELPLFLSCYLVLLMLALVLKRGVNTQDILFLLLPLYVLAFPLGFTYLKMWGFVDMSILRYTTIVFFLVPMIFANISPRVDIDNKYARTCILSLLYLIGIFILGEILIRGNVDFNYQPTSGQYKDFIWHQDYYRLGETVKTIVPEGSTVMLVDEEGELIGNMDMPAIILRYYISENSVGEQYRYPVFEWYNYVQKVEPDYILVYTYDNYWSGCNQILEKANSYLIKAGNLSEEYTEEGCFFSAEDLISL